MGIVQQLGLFGEISPPAGLSPADQVALVMEYYPETRDDDRLLFVRFWQVFDGLEHVLDEEALERFAAWFAEQATHPETIRRRRQEHQRNGDGGGHLLPSPGVADYRRAQSKAGPPRR